MKAVGYRQNLPLNEPESLLDVDLAEPTPGPSDLLVEVHAVSVNPVDTKVRKGATPEPGQARVLGWGAAGTVLLGATRCITSRPATGSGTPAAWAARAAMPNTRWWTSASPA